MDLKVPKLAQIGNLRLICEIPLGGCEDLYYLIPEKFLLWTCGGPTFNPVKRTSLAKWTMQICPVHPRRATRALAGRQYPPPKGRHWSWLTLKTSFCIRNFHWRWGLGCVSPSCFWLGRPEACVDSLLVEISTIFVIRGFKYGKFFSKQFLFWLLHTSESVL